MNFRRYRKVIQYPDHPGTNILGAIEISAKIFHPVVLQDALQMQKDDFEVTNQSGPRFSLEPMTK